MPIFDMSKGWRRPCKEDRERADRAIWAVIAKVLVEMSERERDKFRASASAQLRAVEGDGG